MGAALHLMKKHRVKFRKGIHIDQGIVQSFNRTLAEGLFGFQYQYAKEIYTHKRNREWSRHCLRTYGMKYPHIGLSTNLNSCLSSSITLL